MKLTLIGIHKKNFQRRSEIERYQNAKEEDTNG